MSIVDTKPRGAIFLENQHHWAGPRTSGRLYHSLGLHLPKLSNNFSMERQTVCDERAADGVGHQQCQWSSVSDQWSSVSDQSHLCPLLRQRRPDDGRVYRSWHRRSLSCQQSVGPTSARSLSVSVSSQSCSHTHVSCCVRARNQWEVIYTKWSWRTHKCKASENPAARESGLRD